MVVHRTYNIRESNYDPIGQVITLPRSRSFEAKITELHEYAHVAQEKAGMTPMDYGRDPVGNEAEASALALAFVKSEFEHRTFKYHIAALESHVIGRGYGNAEYLLAKATITVKFGWLNHRKKRAA